MGADWVMSAIVGAAGLAPDPGRGAQPARSIALANKESLVCAGPALLATAKAAGGGGDPGRFRALGDLPGAAAGLRATASRG